MTLNWSPIAWPTLAFSLFPILLNLKEMNLKHIHSVLDKSQSCLCVWHLFSYTGLLSPILALNLPLNWWSLGFHQYWDYMCIPPGLCRTRGWTQGFVHSAHWATSPCLLFIPGIFYDTVTFWTNSTSLIIWTFMLIALPWSPQSIPPETFRLRFLSVSSGSWLRSYQGRLCGWWGLCWACTSQQVTLLLLWSPAGWWGGLGS